MRKVQLLAVTAAAGTAVLYFLIGLACCTSVEASKAPRTTCFDSVLCRVPLTW